MYKWILVWLFSGGMIANAQILVVQDNFSKQALYGVKIELPAQKKKYFLVM